MDLDFFEDAKEILEELKNDGRSSQVIFEIDGILKYLLVWYKRGRFEVSKCGRGDCWENFDCVNFKNIEDATIYICGIDGIFNIENFYIESK